VGKGGWREADRQLPVDGVAPYEGVVIAGRDTLVLVIEAEGAWEIEVTAR
jgi:hypothetical protein